MLQIWNLRYYKNFFIIKCLDLESIIFVINMDIVLSSKVFSTIVLGQSSPPKIRAGLGYHIIDSKKLDPIWSYLSKILTL